MEKFSEMNSKSELVYKVIAGSFILKENAEERVKYLQLHGIVSFWYAVKHSNGQVYRVQAGAFFTREYAESQLEEVKETGINDAYILVELKDEGLSISPLTIIGATILTGKQMDAFVRMVNPHATQLGKYYELFGRYYGVRGDVAFAQSILETDYFLFSGVVQPAQNNFAGIGTTSQTVRGAVFASAEEGILAQIQHLFAYATTKELPNKYQLVDPRFHLVKRGSATTWLDLNGKWAVPGDEYGQTIINIYERMISIK